MGNLGHWSPVGGDGTWGGVGRTRAQCALEACQGLRPNQGNQPGKGATKARVLLKPQEPGSSEEFMKMHKKYERQRVL